MWVFGFFDFLGFPVCGFPGFSEMLDFTIAGFWDFGDTGVLLFSISGLRGFLMIPVFGF